MTVNGVELTDSFDIANHFNDYFVSVAKKLVKKVPKTNDNRLIYLGPSFSDSFYLYPITSQETQKIISGLKTKHSFGTDGIPLFLIKPIPNIIINLSISTGTFISCFKKAKVIPIFEKGSQLLVENYRPISLLFVFSKVLEKIYTIGYILIATK